MVIVSVVFEILAVESALKSALMFCVIVSANIYIQPLLFNIMFLVLVLVGAYFDEYPVFRNDILLLVNRVVIFYHNRFSKMYLKLFLFVWLFLFVFLTIKSKSLFELEHIHAVDSVIKYQKNTAIFLDTLIFVSFSKREFEHLTRIRKETKTRKLQISLFIQLFSHTARNRISGIIPYLDQIKSDMKREITKKRDNKTFYFFRRLANTTIVCSNEVLRYIENLLGFQQMVGYVGGEEKPKQFSLKSFLHRLENILPEEVSVFYRPYGLNVKIIKKEDDNFPKYCLGDSKLLYRLICNFLCGILKLTKSVGIVPSTVTLFLSYEDETFSVKMVTSRMLAEPLTWDTGLLSKEYIIGESDIISLGLLYSQKMIESHLGGRAKIWERPESEGEDGMGVELDLPLPRTSPPEIVPESTAYKAQKSPPGYIFENGFGAIDDDDDDEEGVKVLVLDDLKFCRTIILMMIRTHGERTGKRHTCFEAENGSKGFTAISEGLIEPDLIFTDFNMPVWNGDDFSRNMVSNNLLSKPWCEIYLISGGSFGNRPGFCEKNHFTTIFPKPIGRGTIFEALEDCMEKRRRIRRDKMREMKERRLRKRSVVGLDIGQYNNFRQRGMKNEEEEEEGEEESQSEENEQNVQNIRFEERRIIMKNGRTSLSFFDRLRNSVDFIPTRIFTILVIVTLCVFNPEVISQVLVLFPIMFLTTTITKILLSYLFHDILSNFLRFTIMISLVSLYIPPFRILLCSLYSLIPMTIDENLRNQVSFLLSFTLYVYLFEFFVLYFLHESPRYFNRVFYWMSEIYVFVMLITWTFAMSERRERRENELRETITNYVEEDRKLRLMIKYCSYTFRKYLFYCEHYLIELERSFSFPCMDNENFCIVRKSIVQFRKDLINLFLVHCMLDEERNVYFHSVKKRNNTSRPLPIRIGGFLKDVFEEQIIRTLAVVRNIRINLKCDLLHPSDNETSKLDDIFFKLDPYSLYIIFVNLIQNSIENTPKNGTIDIHVGIIQEGVNDDGKRLFLRISNPIEEKNEENFKFHLARISKNNSEESEEKFDHYTVIRKKRRRDDEESLIEDILTERSVKIGEVTGNPKLGIGWLCCQKLIRYDHIPNSILKIGMEKKKGEQQKEGMLEIQVKFECDLEQFTMNNNLRKNLFSKRRRRKRRNVSEMIVLIFECEYLNVSRLLDYLIERGIKNENVRRISTQKELERKYFSTTITTTEEEEGKYISNDEYFDVCIIGRVNSSSHSSSSHSSWKSNNLQRCSCFQDSFFIFVTDCFGEHGLVENGVVCLNPIGRSDLRRCFDFVSSRS